MATYAELHALRGSSTVSTLQQKIAVAIAIKATAIAKSANPTAAAKAFATAALKSPEAYLDQVMNYLLADNAGQTTSAITGASDNTVQTAVNAAVDTLLAV